MAVRYLWGLTMVTSTQPAFVCLSYCPKPPKMDPKNDGIFQVKLRMAYRQTLKLGMDKLWKNVEAKGYVIISIGHLAVYA